MPRVHLGWKTDCRVRPSIGDDRREAGADHPLDNRSFPKFAAAPLAGLVLGCGRRAMSIRPGRFTETGLGVATARLPACSEQTLSWNGRFDQQRGTTSRVEFQPGESRRPSNFVPPRLSTANVSRQPSLPFASAPRLGSARPAETSAPAICTCRARRPTLPLFDRKVISRNILSQTALSGQPPPRE